MEAIEEYNGEENRFVDWEFREFRELEEKYRIDNELVELGKL
jgi:hypothetical protein